MEAALGVREPITKQRELTEAQSGLVEVQLTSVGLHGGVGRSLAEQSATNHETVHG